MKKLFLFCVCSFFSCYGTFLHAQSCCIKKDNDWKLLAKNDDFKASHLAPEPFVYENQKGSMIQFKTLDGKDGHAYYIPSDAPTNKVLLVFHEWWGLNDYIKREAEKWQKQLGNIDVYAIDLYDGEVAKEPEAASKLANSLETKRAENIIKGALSKIGRDAQVATLGWCMGGAWSFTASVLAANQAAGCVMFYGFPEQDAKRIASIQTDVFYVWGSRDKFIKKGMVDEFGEKIKTTKHNFDLHIYDADHAFANPSNPKYNAVAATEAETLALKFLKTKMELE